jgi:hypothetical protein
VSFPVALIGLSLASTSTLTGEALMNQLIPCTPGLRIEYEDTLKEGKGSVSRTIETVRGPGKEPRTCVIDRVVKRPDGKEDRDAWAREMLPDRITNAGWVDHPMAFRTPLLRTPIQPGRKWHFNTTDFEIKDVGDTFDVPAGTFEGCVRVFERSSDATHEASSVYAPKVGLILYESKTHRVRAVKVTMPTAHETAQDRAPPARRKDSSKTSR